MLKSLKINCSYTEAGISDTGFQKVFQTMSTECGTI